MFKQNIDPQLGAWNVLWHRVEKYTKANMYNYIIYVLIILK